MKWRTYPTYRDSGVEWLGEIPEHWSTQKLKFNSYIKGRIGWQNLRGDEFTDAGPFLVTGMHFKDGSVDWDSCYHITEDRYLMAPEIFVQEGDVLITKDGSIGKLAYIDQLPGKASLNSHLLIIRPVGDAYTSRFLYHLLGSELFQRFVVIEQKGTTFYGITQESVESFPAVLPASDEQRSIASFLDRETGRIDELIAKKQRQIELLQEKRSALISHVVTKGLDPDVKMKDSGVEWLGKIPEHWKVKKLKHIVQDNLVNGIFKKKDSFGSGVKLINVYDIYRDDFFVHSASLERVEVEVSEQKKYAVFAGDIFFVRSSLKLEGVGRSVCALDIDEPTVFECHVVRTRPKRELVNPRYLIHYLNSAPTINRLVSLSNNVTMATIDQDKIKNLEIVLPPRTEQDLMMASLEQDLAFMYDFQNRILTSIEKLREYRTALISAAVTGKIDVREEVA